MSLEPALAILERELALLRWHIWVNTTTPTERAVHLNLLARKANAGRTITESEKRRYRPASRPSA